MVSKREACRSTGEKPPPWKRGCCVPDRTATPHTRGGTPSRSGGACATQEGKREQGGWESLGVASLYPTSTSRKEPSAIGRCNTPPTPC